MQIIINGEPRKVETELNLRQLLEKLELPTERVAIELNKDVIRKKDWETDKNRRCGQDRNNSFRRRRMILISVFKLRFKVCELNFYNSARFFFAVFC